MSGSSYIPFCLTNISPDFHPRLFAPYRNGTTLRTFKSVQKKTKILRRLRADAKRIKWEMNQLMEGLADSDDTSAMDSKARTLFAKKQQVIATITTPSYLIHVTPTTTHRI